MPPIPKFAKVLVQRAKAKPKVISGGATTSSSIPLPYKDFVYSYASLIKNIDKEVGLDLCNTPSNKNLLKNFLTKIYNIDPGNIDIKRPTDGAIATLDAIDSAPKLLKFINRIKSIYKTLKALDQNVMANKDITAKIKYIKNVLEVEYYHIIDNSVAATTKTVRDDQIEKVIALPSTTINASYSTTKDSVNRFAHDGNWTPSVQDIRQGLLGDCYLLSALLALIETGNGNVIKNCFVGSDSNKVTLRFFKLKVTVKEKNSETNKYIYRVIPTGKVEITVNKSILIDPLNQLNVANQTNAVWVNLFEKAFAIYKNDKSYVVCGDTAINPYKSKPFVDGWYSRNKTSLPAGTVASVQDVNNGYGAIAMASITGKAAKFAELLYDRNSLGKKFPDPPVAGDTNRYHDRANKLYEMFDKKLKKGNIITVNTRASTFKKLPAAIKTIWEVTPPPPYNPKNTQVFYRIMLMRW